MDTFRQAIEPQNFDPMILSQYQGQAEHLEKITLRMVQLQNKPHLSCLYRYKTQDVTKNYRLAEAIPLVYELLQLCKQANLIMPGREVQLKKQEKSHADTD